MALFVRTWPDRLSKIEQIVWMGGPTGRGNQSPYAEFSAWADPEAAAVVTGAGARFRMVGLNITHQTLVTADVLARVTSVGNATARFGAELLRFFNSTYEAENMPAAPLHDPVAVALVADPGLLACAHTRLDVERSTPRSRPWPRGGAAALCGARRRGRPGGRCGAEGVAALATSCLVPRRVQAEVAAAVAGA